MSRTVKTDLKAKKIPLVVKKLARNAKARAKRRLTKHSLKEENAAYEFYKKLQYKGD